MHGSLRNFAARLGNLSSSGVTLATSGYAIAANRQALIALALPEPFLMSSLRPAIKPFTHVVRKPEQFEDAANGCEVAATLLSTGRQIGIEPSSAEIASGLQMCPRSFEFLSSDALVVGLAGVGVAGNRVDQGGHTTSDSPALHLELSLGSRLGDDGAWSDVRLDAINDHGSLVAMGKGSMTRCTYTCREFRWSRGHLHGRGMRLWDCSNSDYESASQEAVRGSCPALASLPPTPKKPSPFLGQVNAHLTTLWQCGEAR